MAKEKLKDGEELVQSPGNPETQVDKDKLDPSQLSEEGYPTLRDKTKKSTDQ